jgi:hypothetical protein
MAGVVAARTQTPIFHPTYGWDAILEDRKIVNADGGTFTGGAYRTRDLNYIAFNPKKLVTLANNQFTLPTGRWKAKWSCAMYSCGRTQTALFNITDSVYVISGMTSYAGAADSGSVAHGEAVFDVVAGPKIYELRHYADTGGATNGFGAGLGVLAGLGYNMYSQICLKKLG